MIRGIPPLKVHSEEGGSLCPCGLDFRSDLYTKLDVTDATSAHIEINRRARTVGTSNGCANDAKNGDNSLVSAFFVLADIVVPLISLIR